MFAPVLDPFDRPAEASRGVRDHDVLGIDHELRPETASEIGGADDDPALVEPEYRHQGAERAVRGLAGQPDGQAVVERVGDRDHASALDRQPEALVLAKRHRDPVRGGGESGLHVAVADVVLRKQVVLEAAVRGRGVGRERVAAIRDRRKPAVVDHSTRAAASSAA